MMKKSLEKILFFLIGAVVVIAGCSRLLDRYYQNTYAVNTWVNDFYSTGKSVSEINDALVAKATIPSLSIDFGDGVVCSIAGTAFDMLPDYSASIKKNMKQRANYSWVENLNNEVSIQLEPDFYTFNREKLEQQIYALSPVASEMAKETGCALLYTPGQGYSLYDGNAHRLDVDRMIRLIARDLDKGVMELNVSDSACYVDLPDSKEDTAKRKLLVKIQNLFGEPLVYDMGAEQIELTGEVLCDLLAMDEQNLPLLNEAGEPYPDEEKVAAWVEALGETYNTANREKDFLTTAGDYVKVTYDTYGTELDLEAELAFFRQAIHQKRGQKEIHVPAYLKEGYARGVNDIGETYIEVDLTNQKLYYYQDGVLEIDTDVVTGNMKRKWNTPEGVFFVYNKQKNRVLRGPNYRTPVKFWIPVRGAIGIHDAKWRDEFGGDIYLTDGSHGCVNTPMDAVEKLYEMVEIGTPCVMYYRE